MDSVQKEAKRLVSKFLFADIYFVDGHKGALRKSIGEGYAAFETISLKLKTTVDMTTKAQPKQSSRNSGKLPVSRSALILKYSDRLKIMKENRANEMDFLNDAENASIDRQIQMVAEFISDLKSAHFG